MGEALEKFVAEAQGLYANFESTTLFSIGGWNISQYTLYMFIALALVLLAVLIGARKLEFIPHKKFTAILEYGYDFISNSVGADVIGEGYKKHIPFLATLFFFILFANVIGLIPGAKAATGTISITWALALVSFIYFNFYGFKQLGFFKYMKSFAPHGVPGPMIPVIWFLEFVSMVIRVLTLAVRLYGNMLAGHMILAVFSLGNHHLPANCYLQHGSGRWYSGYCLVLPALLHVCTRDAGCVLAGIRFYDPVVVLHRYGYPSSLGRKAAALWGSCDPCPLNLVLKRALG